MKNLPILLFLIICTIGAKAQLLDSLQVQVGTTVSVASKDFLPLWLVSNRFGVISDQKFDFSTHVKATNSNRFKFAADEKDDLILSYGVDAYNNDHLGKVFLAEAYAGLSYKNLKLRAGRFKQVIGEVDKDLSSGSLGVSGNALPVPKVSLSLDYTNVPFTNGWVQFKGLISHGWMGEDQFMKNAFYHEKNLYVRLGKKKLKLYGGLQHYAVWGGTRDGYITTGTSFSDFLDVLMVNIGNDGDMNALRPNRAGDHRGVIEAGAEWENENMKISLNNQTPFDMGQGIDIRNIDRLLSLNFVNKKKNAILKKVVLEFIHTTQMNDFFAIQYRESYYNNGVYRTGWEYQDQIIGTPLFINRVRGSNFIEGIQPYDWNGPTSSIAPLSNIISNRVLGGHIGLMYKLTKDIDAKTMVTYTKNYGNNNPKYFNPAQSQMYSLQEVSWKVPRSQLSLSASVAYDWGGLYDNFGSMVGLQWQLRN